MVSFPTIYQRVVVHWRAIILLVILTRVAFLVASSDEFVSFELNLFALLLIFIASQVFWIGRIVDLGKWLFPDQPRVRLVVIADLVYLFIIAYSFPTTIAQGHTFRIGFYRLPVIVTEAVFWWWFVGSMLAFLLVIVFGLLDRVVRAAAWTDTLLCTLTYLAVGDCSVCAQSPPVLAADRRANQCHAVCGYRLRTSLRSAECGSRAPAYPPGTLGYDVVGLPYAFLISLSATRTPSVAPPSMNP